MGSQQLLLLIVGVLMVGLMIAVGIIMFADSAAASNRDAIANDLAVVCVQGAGVLPEAPVLSAAAAARSWDSRSTDHSAKQLQR